MVGMGWFWCWIMVVWDHFGVDNVGVGYGFFGVVWDKLVWDKFRCGLCGCGISRGTTPLWREV